MSMTSTGCETSVWPSPASGSGRRSGCWHELLHALLGEGGFEHLLPAGHLRVPAQKRTAFAFGHASPDPELDPVVESVSQTLIPDRAAATDALRDVLLRSLHKQCIRITVPARRQAWPIGNHPHWWTVAPRFCLSPGTSGAHASRPVWPASNADAGS